MSLPPNPGSPPPEFHFPFGEAERAVAALEEALSRLRHLTQTHHDAAGEARVDFQGRVRQRFDTDLGDHMGQIDDLVSRLQAERDGLQIDIGYAHIAQQANDDAIAQWHRDKAVYDSAVLEEAAAR